MELVSKMSNLRVNSIKNKASKNITQEPEIKTVITKTRVYWVETLDGTLEKREKIITTTEIKNTPKTMGTKKILGIIYDYDKWCERVYEVAESSSKVVSSLSNVKVKVAQTCILISSILATPTVHAYAVQAGAEAFTSGLKEVFDILMEIALAIGEPILWFYALTALIMMATGKNKHIGLARLKTVLYSYVMVRMLPTFFSFLGWFTGILQDSFKGVINGDAAKTILEQREGM